MINRLLTLEASGLFCYNDSSSIKPMISPYTVVPGTAIVHSTTDCYELYDEAEGQTLTVKLQADDGGVYLQSTGKQHDIDRSGITEYMSISNKDLAICVAKRILEIYSVN